MTNYNRALEAYRVNVYGERRNDFDMCLVALSSQLNKITLTSRAIKDMSEETANDEHARTLIAAYEMLRDIAGVMGATITVLTDSDPNEDAEAE